MLFVQVTVSAVLTVTIRSWKPLMLLALGGVWSKYEIFILFHRTHVIEHLMRMFPNSFVGVFWNG
jgi:hypothetical protein